MNLDHARLSFDTAGSLAEELEFPSTSPSTGRPPSDDEIERAVRTLIAATGDDPDREGLRGTPGRVVRAYSEWFSGYGDDPVALLQ